MSLRRLVVFGACGVGLMVMTSPARAQTCPLPPADCTGALHCGGEWDFENGFYFTPHFLAGQCDAPPGGGNESCVPADKVSQVGTGWTHWASFPTWETGGYWGTCAFNENKNCANVMRGNRSQELTMTCANGVGVIYKQATVPAGHRIQVEAFMKFTPNGDAPDVEHAIGIDPAGGTDPASPDVQWTEWQERVPSPPQPGSVFNRGTAEAIAQGSAITVFIRERAFEPPCQGQTFLVDNVKIFDLGVPGPALSVTPQTLSNTAVVGFPPADQALMVRNSGEGTLTYNVSDDADWLSVSPTGGTSTGEEDTLTVSYDAAELGVGTYEATITVDAGIAADSPQTVSVSLEIGTKPADYDNDGDVDLNDYGMFQVCLNEVGQPLGPGCEAADFDGDSDVDSQDFSKFMGCMSGEAVASDPLCLQ